MVQQIPLGLYLWTRYAIVQSIGQNDSRLPANLRNDDRLRQLGISSIMGVPGDMNLELLDYIKEVEGLQWGTP